SCVPHAFLQDRPASNPRLAVQPHLMPESPARSQLGDRPRSKYVGSGLMMKLTALRTGTYLLLTLVTLPALNAAELYHEPFRPQFHFSPAKTWMNDPNGLVYYDGEYHL